MFITAHGEGWEIVASRAVGSLVKEILEENQNENKSSHRRGTFSLHYIPENFNEKTIAIPLTTSNGILQNQSPYFLANDGQRNIHHGPIFRC